MDDRNNKTEKSQKKLINMTLVPIPAPSFGLAFPFHFAAAIGQTFVCGDSNHLQ